MFLMIPVILNEVKNLLFFRSGGFFAGAQNDRLSEFSIFPLCLWAKTDSSPHYLELTFANSSIILAA